MLKSSIKNRYVKDELHHISQGDILRDAEFACAEIENGDVVVKRYLFSYIIVISQDCDLLQCNLNQFDPRDKINNQFLPNVIILPAFPEAVLREGKHLVDLHGIVQERINSAKYNIIRQNKDERYHYLVGDPILQIPDLAIDFKYYVSFPYQMVRNNYNTKYLASMNELFREELSSRFATYLSRIGLPEV